MIMNQSQTATQSTTQPRPWYRPSLTTQILIGLVVGGGLGYISPKWGNNVYFLRDIFLNLIKSTLAKDLKFTERVGASFTLQFTNVFNHRQPSDPSSLSLSSPTNFGKITTSVYASRQMEFGLRIHF